MASKYGPGSYDQFDNITNELEGWNSTGGATLKEFVKFMFFDIDTLVDVEILRGLEK